MGAVVVLMTLLVTLLSGLTAGLGRESTSGIADLPADHLVFSGGEGRDVSFADSAVTAEQQRAWAREPGVTTAELLAITTTKASAGTGDGARSAAVTVPAVADGSALLPGDTRVGDGDVVLSTGAAQDLGAAAAGTVPFALTASTMLAPPLVLVVLGALGAVLSVRRITSVDPLTALGGAR